MTGVHRAAAVAALLWATAPGQAQEIEIGARLFARHCATCHGTTGQGAGEMQPYLTLPVPDLTALSRDNGGAFPMARVIMVIDGRTRPRGHLGPMPFFAPLFAREGGAGTGPGDAHRATLEAQGRILLLARYLETIQAESEPAE